MAHHDTGHEIASSGWRYSSLACIAVVGTAAVVLATVISGSFARILAFAAALALFAAPGWALAGRWFSGFERHATGIAIGYFLSTITASFLYRLGVLTPVKLGFVLVAVTAVIVYAARRSQVSFRQDSQEERFWLVATLAVAMSLVALPYLRIGQETVEGFAYRSYFQCRPHDPPLDLRGDSERRFPAPESVLRRSLARLPMAFLSLPRSGRRLDRQPTCGSS